MQTKKIISISICILISLVFFISAYSQAQPGEKPKLIIFHSPTCHKCLETKNKLMPDIEKEFKGRIQIEYRDITDIENYKLLLSLKEKHGSKIENILPVFYFQGHFLNGRGQIKKEALRVLIGKSLSQESEGKQGLPSIDLIAYFRTFEPFAIISAGLADGINPCAFTVIVFFISFLSLQGYRKRELIIIGLTFIFAVFITYLAIGLGLFSFFYQLRGFWIISKIFNLTVGILSIILGVLALYDFFKFKRTAQTEGLLLQLPQAVKSQIHSLIGLHYRRTKEEGGKASRVHILRLALSALIVGFLVSILEAVCTGQVYLPTITFVLKATHLKLQALSYLILYNVMFIVPLFIIFLFALLGVTSEQFSRLLKRHLSTIKILMAILFFGLGIFLIWRP
jgi:thiol-disulfide isomerase/thioredoxin